MFRVRHTRNANARIEDAHRALNTIQEEVVSLEEKLNMLVQRKMTRETTASILDRLFPKTKDESGKEESSTRRENVLAEILRGYESNDRDAFPEQRGTAYNLLNAITGYVDHSRSSRNGERAESAVFGSGDALKSEAFEMILESANTLPAVARKQIFVPTVRPEVTIAAPKFNGSQGSLLDLIVNNSSN